MAKPPTAEQKLARIKRAFVIERPIKGEQLAIVSTHAAFNLEGAIISIEYDAGRCSKATMRTLNRVARQLDRISAILEMEG